MTKRELIDEILDRNHTAQPEFLAQFRESELGKYLKNLDLARQPRLTGDASRYDKYFQKDSTSWAARNGVSADSSNASQKSSATQAA